MEQAQQVQSLRRSFSRLTRLINQLMREQLSCGPITVQQCHTLEAVVEGPKSMKQLATEVGLHQSTLTRIVEKLEKQGFLERRRKPGDQRSVEVRTTETGLATYWRLHGESSKMILAILEMIPEDGRPDIVKALDTLAELLDPRNEAFKMLLDCCSGCCPEPRKKGDVA